MTASARRWWPQMNATLPPWDPTAPRCRNCHHRDGDHGPDGACLRWLTVASSALEPPEVVLCGCRRNDPLLLPGVHTLDG